MKSVVASGQGSGASESGGQSIEQGFVDPHHWRGYFLIAAATLGWAGAATVSKAMFKGALFPGQRVISPLLLTQARTTFTVLLILVFVSLRYGRAFFRISRRDLLWSALAGTLGTAGSNFFYYYAVQKSTVAIAITLQYTAAVWVLLFMVICRGERLTLRRAGSVVLAVAGIILAWGVFQRGPANSSPISWVGPVAALGASFSFAFYNIAAAGLVHRNGPLQIMVYSLGSAAVLWAILSPPWLLPAQHLSLGQWEFLFCFACLSMLLPYICFFYGLKYLDPTRAVIASCLEPVFAILLTAMFVHEGVNGWQIVGVAAVLVATVTAQIKEPNSSASV